MRGVYFILFYTWYELLRSPEASSNYQSVDLYRQKCAISLPHDSEVQAIFFVKQPLLLYIHACLIRVVHYSNIPGFHLIQVTGCFLYPVFMTGYSLICFCVAYWVCLSIVYTVLSVSSSLLLLLLLLLTVG